MNGRAARADPRVATIRPDGLPARRRHSHALGDADDAWHERARDWTDAVTELLIVPVTVQPEVAYLLDERLGAAAELAFVQSAASGELEIEPLRHRI